MVNRNIFSKCVPGTSSAVANGLLSCTGLMEFASLLMTYSLFGVTITIVRGSSSSMSVVVACTGPVARTLDRIA